MRNSYDELEKRYKKAGIYLIASIVLALAGAVYEHFSHGVYSGYMIYAFMIPLVLGCATYLTKASRVIEAGGQAAELLFAGAVTTLSIGSVLQGVLEIYGTTNHLIAFYPVVGIFLLAATLTICAINMTFKKAAEH